MTEKCLKIHIYLSFISLSFSLFFSNSNCYAQINYNNEFRQLSCPEKRWVLFHPFIAKKSFRLTQEARTSSKEMAKSSLLDGDENGGQVDAFRHAYWMALLSQNICWRKARSLGKAHEKGNYRDFKKHRMEEEVLPDSASGAMDLFNNEAGIVLGRANKKISEEELINVVRDAVISGKMKIIRKEKNGVLLDCEGNPIHIEDYRHQWNIPKCLVDSDFKNQR